jgi:hypothetical protein
VLLRILSTFPAAYFAGSDMEWPISVGEHLGDRPLAVPATLHRLVAGSLDCPHIHPIDPLARDIERCSALYSSVVAEARATEVPIPYRLLMM